jgi:DNA-binding PadR family transcriptional regulator
MDEPLTPLSMAVLLALMSEPKHGYALMREVEAQTGRRPGTGTLYAALDRLTGSGLIRDADEVVDEEDRRRKYFAITQAGERAARREAARMLSVLDEARALAVFGTLNELRNAP